jgi:cell division protein FtsW
MLCGSQLDRIANPGDYMARKLLVTFVAILAGGLVAFLNVRVLARFGWAIYTGSLIFAVLLFVPGIARPYAGRAMYIVLGPMVIQPFGLLAYGAVLCVAWIFWRARNRRLVRWHSWVPAGLILVPLCLLFGLGHLSAMAQYAVFALGFLLLNRLPILPLAVGVIVAGPLALWSYPFLWHRISQWLGLAVGYQVEAVAKCFQAGGWLGVGYLNGTHKGWVPDGRETFALAGFAEEFGWVGVIIVLALEAVLVATAFKISASSKGKVERALSTGAGCWFATRTLTSVCVVFGLAPVIRSSLPFFSASFSMLLADCLFLGMLMRLTYSPSREA